jgi:lipopolysaccharide biosynthesis protein
MRYFASKNYIRIANRPLVLVYRVDLFPDFRRTAAIWRDVCRREGFGEIYLAMVASFDLSSQHPAGFGCDAVIEFPPHAASVRAYDHPPSSTANFQGEVYDYRASILNFVGRPVPPFTRFRSAMPGWDNTPRLGNDANIFINSSPGAFQAWLETIMQLTREQNPPDQRFVFINAWNEWGEGAYLEPDTRFGHGYLEAVRNAHERWHLARP